MHSELCIPSAHTQPHCRYGSQTPVPSPERMDCPVYPVSKASPAWHIALQLPRIHQHAGGKAPAPPNIKGQRSQLLLYAAINWFSASSLITSSGNGWLWCKYPHRWELWVLQPGRGAALPLLPGHLLLPLPATQRRCYVWCPLPHRSPRLLAFPIKKWWTLWKDEGKWIEGSSFWGRGKLLTLKADRKQQWEQHELGVSNFSFTEQAFQLLQVFNIICILAMRHHFIRWLLCINVLCRMSKAGRISSEKLPFGTGCACHVHLVRDICCQHFSGK